MQASQTIPAPPLTSTIYPEPKIEVQPKSDWKLRYSKDLIPNQRNKPDGKARKKTKVKRKTQKQAKVKRRTRKPAKVERMTKFIELLHGVGSKGSRIKVEVSYLLFKNGETILLHHF
jgi:hypothetical protein